MKIKKLYHIVLSVLFLTVILTMFLIFIFSPKDSVNNTENRTLSEKPKLDIAKLDPYPRAYEAFFNDHFPFRNFIIKNYNLINIKMMKKSLLPNKVVIGNNNWLFMGDNQLKVYQRIIQFTDAELKSIEEELIYREDFCRNRDINFYFFIIPQKHSIYGEEIPYYYSRINEKTIREQLVDYLDMNNRFKAYDLESLFRAKKTDYQLFRKTDNHWNDIGAFYATNEIIRIIKKDFPVLEQLKFSDYTIKHKMKLGGNIPQMLDMQEEFKEVAIELIPKFETTATDGTKKNYTPPENFAYPWEYEIVKVNPNAQKLKVLIIRESFASYQVKFYQEIFGECVFVFDEWKHKLNEDIIENEKPDIVILQILESFLPNLLKYQSKPKKQSN